MTKLLCWLGVHSWAYGYHQYSGVRFHVCTCRYCNAIEPGKVEIV